MDNANDETCRARTHRMGQRSRSAGALVALGKSGIKVTRLGFGTGSQGGRVQRQLGQKQFTRLVRYAYELGVRFFDTAEDYATMHRMLGLALKGIPRDSYQLMSKVTTQKGVNPQKRIYELLKLANTEYFDVLLMHCQRGADWPADTMFWQDGIQEAKSRKVVLGIGASVHGLPALRRLSQSIWVEIAMVRTNHNGTMMDAENNSEGRGDVLAVLAHVEKLRAQGVGVIGMKLAGEGAFTDHLDRQAAMRFALRRAQVDCVVLGYKNTSEIDEAAQNVNLALEIAVSPTPAPRISAEIDVPGPPRNVPATA